MKKILVIMILALCISSGAKAEEPSNPFSAAILDFQASEGLFSGKGGEAALLLGTHLSDSPNLFLVDRQDLEKILGEQEIGLSGLVSPDTAAKIGSLTGAKILVMGRLFDTGGKYFLVAKIMSTETSRVYGETAIFTDVNGLDGATKELGEKISSLIAKHGDAFTVKAEDFSVQIERLKKSVEGKKLPSVGVSVTEEHLRRPVIDPAVETELKRGLQQIGFEVIDSKETGKQPQVRISGEAFSEFAGRHGNLFICRARVEIKVINTATGKLIMVDRETDVGVDLAENIAGKKALENAARKLLDRMVPKLAD